MLLFFYIRGIVHYEFVPTGQTVNQVYYLEVLKRLREKVRRKRPELFANNSWILHHDNSPAHTALSVREFLATKQIAVLEHPVYF